jgi:hypothetical protein
MPGTSLVSSNRLWQRGGQQSGRLMVGVSRKVLGGLLTACVVGSVLVSQPLAAAPGVSLQVWTCNGIPATIVGTPAGELLKGTPAADVIVAREGNDIIRGLGGDDIICAGKGNDIVYGGAGFDILFGAQGNDVLYAKNGATAFQRADNRGARMFGGADDDRIYGSNKWDRMQGGPGNDQLFGYEGRDWLRAGPGNDAVDGGPGIDNQHGGNGRDDIQVTNGDIVRGGAGLDLCRVTGEPALLRSCGRNIRETPPVSHFVGAWDAIDADASQIQIRVDPDGGFESVDSSNLGCLNRGLPGGWRWTGTGRFSTDERGEVFTATGFTYCTTADGGETQVGDPTFEFFYRNDDTLVFAPDGVVYTRTVIG